MDLYYLTGIDEPDAYLLLTPQAPIHPEVLLLSPRDVEGEIWDGERAPLPNKALELSTGIARIQRHRYLPRLLLGACEQFGALVYVGDFQSYAQGEDEILGIYGKTVANTLGCQIRDLHGTLSSLRVVKEPEELALMRKAIDYTAAGHRAALGAARPGAREYEVKDAVEDGFRRAGSRHVAFESITGSGPNSAVLHYPKDDRVLKDGELVVVDVGAEAEYYAADVTRTLPVSARFTKAQRDVYEIVLAAQKVGIARARKGATMDEIDLATRQVIEDAGYYDHYLHYCCHYVGLQVHDVGSTRAPLPAGAVITVEPGIYLPHQGFGVRIEDEVLITDGDAEVLTGAIPKDADELERLMAEARK
jgi:Xaa-Pro aminopeptidase